MVELVRERWLFQHATPDARSITLEYVVRNNTGSDLYQLYFPIKDFLYGLQIVDETGRLLNYLPNAEVEAALEELKEEDETAYNIFMARWAKARYRICVVFPKDSPLRPGEMRTIRFLHTDGRRPKYVKRSLLKLPSYYIEHERLPIHSHSLFVVVQAPPDTHLSVDLQDQEPRNLPHYHVTAPPELDYHFSAHLPAPKKPYEWSVTYHVGPTKVEQAVLSLWWALALAIGAWSLLAGQINGLTPLKPTAMTALTAGATAASAGLLIGLKQAWAERFRVLLLLPILLSALGWLRWILMEM